MKKSLLFLFVLGNVILNVPCNAMVQDEENVPQPSILKKVKGLSLQQLQEEEATASYSWIPGSLGNMLKVEEGELKVVCPSIENENQILEIYTGLKEKINNGLEAKALDITSKSHTHQGAKCIGKQSMKLLANEDFYAEQALFGSSGPIELTSPRFTFKTSFIDVDPEKTVVKLFPHASLKSPIEYLEISPRKTPLFVQGNIDFEDLSFDDFMVSHSDINLKFRK